MLRKKEPKTVGQMIEWATEFLETAGIATPETDARILVADGLMAAVDDLAARADEVIEGDAAETITGWIERRGKREPLAYIQGRTSFYGLPLRVDRRVHVPNPASAVMVHLAARFPKGSRVHDVGTGSGAIALAIKHTHPHLIVSGSDLSAEAIEVAEGNAKHLGLDVTFTAEPWLPEGTYDFVTANLPYVDEQQAAVPIPPEYARHQPRIAVYTEGDGLSLIRELIDRIRPTTAIVALQHAPSQTYVVRNWFYEPETFGDNAESARARITVGRLR